MMELVSAILVMVRPPLIPPMVRMQYTPMPGMSAPLDRQLTDAEYDAVLSWMYLNNLQGFVQEPSAADTSAILTKS